MQTHRTLVALSLLPLAFVAVGVGADELTKEQLASQLSGIDAKDISNSPVQGIYQVAVGSNVAVLDLNNDGAPEIITATKRGSIIFWNNWKAARKQP